MQIADCSLDAEGRLYSQCDNEVDITGTDSARFIAVCDVTYFSYDLMMWKCLAVSVNIYVVNIFPAYI